MSRNALISVICNLLNRIAFGTDWSMILTSLGQCLATAGDAMATTIEAATRMLLVVIPPAKDPPITGLEANLRTIGMGVNEFSAALGSGETGNQIHVIPTVLDSDLFHGRGSRPSLASRSVAAPVLKSTGHVPASLPIFFVIRLGVSPVNQIR